MSNLSPQQLQWFYFTSCHLCLKTKPHILCTTWYKDIMLEKSFYVALADSVLLNVDGVWHLSGCVTCDRCLGASGLSKCGFLLAWQRGGPFTALDLFWCPRCHMMSVTWLGIGEIYEPSEIQCKSMWEYVFAWEVCLRLLTDFQRHILHKQRLKSVGPVQGFSLRNSKVDSRTGIHQCLLLKLNS